MAVKAPRLGASGSVDLDEAVFGEPYHGPLVHEAATAELAARRRGTASTKTRGEIAMTGAKAWRQKGTGRARAGALSTPQRVGGGVAFGPKPHGHIAKVNRKARRRALRSALSVHVDRGTLAIVDAADFDVPSTRRAAEALAGFGEGKALVLLASAGEETCLKSFRNIPRVEVGTCEGAGVADVIGAARLVLSQAAVDHFGSLAPAAQSDRRSRREQEAAA